MKTAMQELIDTLEAKRDEMIRKDRYTSAAACEMLIVEVQEKLSKEREQLGDAWLDGLQSVNGTGNTFDKYFKTTYND